MTNIRSDQGLYQKFIGIGAGDIIIETEDKSMTWRSVSNCKKVESRIWAAVMEAKKNVVGHF